MDYTSCYVPATGTLNFWRDNVADGSATIRTNTGPVALTTEQLAWVNAMYDYPMVAAFNDGTTSYTLSVYSVDVYVSTLSITTTSPLNSAIVGTAYTSGSPLQTMAATGGGPPYTWTLTSQSGGSNTWAVSSAGLITGTPTAAETDTLNIEVTDSSSPSVTVGPTPFTLVVNFERRRGLGPVQRQGHSAGSERTHRDAKRGLPGPRIRAAVHSFSPTGTILAGREFRAQSQYNIYRARSSRSMRAALMQLLQRRRFAPTA